MPKVNGVFSGAVVAVMVLLLIGACAPKPAPASTPAPAPVVASTPGPRTAAQSPQPAARAAWEDTLEKTVDAAQNEGTVLLYTSLGSSARLALAAGFKAKYGIKVETVTASMVEVAQKLSRERTAGLYLGDVMLVGASTLIRLVKPKSALDKIDPILILPDLTDAQQVKNVWWQGSIPWVDADRTILAPLASPAPPVDYNTSIVKAEDVKSYQDLLAPKWKGKISMNDPTVTSFGSTWVASMANNFLGLDYMRQLAKQEPFLTRDSRLQVDWLAHGKYPISLCANLDIMNEFFKVGAPIAFTIPVEGMYVSTGSGGLGLINKAPHPNAAKLFVNWLLSKEGQTILSHATLFQSARVDVSTEGMTPQSLRQPGVKYVSVDDESFQLEVVPKMMDAAKEIFGPLIAK